MPTEQKKRPARIAANAFDLPVDERAAFVEGACGNDESLRAEVESLLAADADAGSFLNRPAVRVPESPATEDALTGATIDGFRVIRRIAVGGMGVVYEAEQQNPHRRVALKVIRAGAASASTLRRFEHEAHVLALLQHPGIAQVYEAGAFDTGHGRQPFFAMELIDGRPLTDYAESADLGTRQRLDLFANICGAVHYAHQRGVIHRDLKPGNVLVDDSGQAKVLDFGVARVTDSDLQTTTQHTAVGELIGTVPYMSPEQVLGDADTIDIRSDVYALGVMLYELLSGKLPHDLRDKAISEAARIICEEEITPLSSVNRIFRGDLETIVSKALEKDKDRRYASAAELAADVRRYLNDEPITARPASAMYQFRKFARRNKAVVGGVGAVFMALVAGAVVATWGLVQANEQRESAETESASLAAINEFLNELLTAVTPEEQGRDVTVRRVLDEAAGRIEAQFIDQPLVEAEIRHTIGASYRSLSHFEEALATFQVAHSLRERHLGEAHPDTLSSLKQVAGIVSELDRHDDAIRLSRRGLALSRQTHGDVHEKTLAWMNTLGVIYWRQMRNEEAIAVLEEALPIQERLYGPDARVTMVMTHNLAAAYNRIDRWSEAETLYKKALDMDRRNGGDGLGVMSSLAVLYSKQTRYDEAAEIFAFNLESRRRTHGDDHHAIANGSYNLATQYSNLERYDEAEELFTKAIDIFREVFGENNRTTLRAKGSLAELYRKQGKLEQALAEQTKILDIRRRVLGPTDPDTLRSLHRLAKVYESLGRCEEAEPFFRDAVELARQQTPAGNSRVGDCLAGLGNCLILLDRFEEAEVALLEAHEIMTAWFGEANESKTHAVVRLIVGLYEDWGRSKQAAAYRAMLPAAQEPLASD